MNDYNTAVGGYDPDETPEAHPSDLMNEDEQAAEESRIATELQGEWNAHYPPSALFAPRATIIKSGLSAAEGA
jgi:hypothetical protein